jgi:tetratricopeptide (TPR) repeat protein
VVFIAAANFYFRKLARKITLQIVRLYETINIFVSNRSHKTAALSFKKSSRELNDLQITFNNVAKTIQIASQSHKDGEEAQALLNYHEAFTIFSDFKNFKDQGVCLNNIGSVHLRRHEYQKAYHYFDRASQLESVLSQESPEATQSKDNLVFSCRHYQKGLSLLLHIKKVYKQMKNLNYGDFGLRGTSVRMNTLTRKMQIKSLNVSKSPFMDQID